MSENTPRHQNVTTFDSLDDETITIPANIIVNTLAYLDELAIVKKEIEKRRLTSSHTVLADLIACLNVFKETGAREVVITVTTDKYGEPALVKHRYAVEKRNVTNS